MMASIIIISNQYKLCAHDMFNLTVWGLSERCTMNPRLVRDLIFFYIYIRRKLYECDKVCQTDTYINMYLQI
jgi:hypothetical protein